MKKIITAFLVLSMVFSLAMPAFAYNDESKGSQDTIRLKYNGHGQYTKASSITNNIKSDIKNLKSGDVIQAKATKDKEIYQISDDKYLTLAYNNTYMMADKIDVNVGNISVSDSNFEKYHVPSKMIEQIKEAISKEKENGNKDFAVSIFAPSIVESSSEQNSESTGGQIADSTGAQSTNSTGGRTTYSTTYYTYSNTYGKYQMKDYSVKYYNCSTGMINKGTDSRNVANALINLALSCIGCGSKTVSIFGAGQSALSVYQSIHGPVVYGQQGDKISTNVIYDKIDKLTYVYIGGWEPGCESYKIWLNRCDTYQFYGYTGVSDLQQNSLNVVYYSQNYNNPNMATGAPRCWYDSSIVIHIYNTTGIL